MKHPVVVRLTGTNAKEAFDLLTEFNKNEGSRMQLHVVSDFDKAANEAVKLASTL